MTLRCVRMATMEPRTGPRFAGTLRDFFGLGGARPDWLTGLRAVFGFGVPLALGVAWGFAPVALVASVLVSITIALAGQWDSPMENLVSTLLISLSTSVLLGVGVIAGHWSITLMGYMAIVAFISGFLPQLGRTGAAAAAVSPIAAFLAVGIGDQPHAPALWQLFLLPLPAALWSAFLIAISWRLQPQPTLRAVEAAFIAQADLVDAFVGRLRGTVDMTDVELKRARRAASSAVEQALVATTPLSLWAPDRNRRAAGRSLVSHLIAISIAARNTFHDASARGVALRDQVAAADALESCADQLRESSAGHRALATWLKTAAAATDAFIESESGGPLRDSGPSDNPLAADLERLAQLQRQGPQRAAWDQQLWDMPGVWQRIRANLVITSPVLRFSVRFATAAAVGAAFMAFTDWPHADWALLTVVVVLKPMMGAAYHRFYQRMLGTVVGALLGGLAAQLLTGEPAVEIVTVSLLVGVGLAFMTVNYFYWVICLTPSIMLVYAIFTPPTLETPGLRIVFTLLGGLIALTANVWVLPNRADLLAPPALARAVTALADYVGTALGPTADGAQSMRLHRRCVLTTDNALAILAAQRDEPGGASGLPVAYQDLVGACEGVRDSVSGVLSRPAVVAQVRSQGGDTVSAIRWQLLDAAAAVRAGSPPAPTAPPEPVPAALGELVQAVQMLRESAVVGVPT